MATLYYDCFAGISGDMNLGALVDLGVDFEHLKSELNKLGLENEFEVTCTKGIKNGIAGTKIHVVDKHHEHHHNHNAYEHHHHRNFQDIETIIQTSNLSEAVKEMAMRIFTAIAISEGKIHGKTIDEVHFHEVGAIDSLVDIVGAAICFEALDVKQIITGKIEVGSGFVRCAHGLIPVPAPATAELLKGFPICSKIDNYEMTTPTGAAILKGMAAEVDLEKNFEIEKIGYGLGTWELEIPNLLRVMLINKKKKRLNG